MMSASRRIKAARSKPLIVPHSPSRADRAQATAWSTSSAPASGTSAQGWRGYGLIDSQGAPDSAGRETPPASTGGLRRAGIPAYSSPHCMSAIARRLSSHPGSPRALPRTLEQRVGQGGHLFRAPSLCFAAHPQDWGQHFGYLLDGPATSRLPQIAASTAANTRRQ